MAEHCWPVDFPVYTGPYSAGHTVGCLGAEPFLNRLMSAAVFASARPLLLKSFILRAHLDEIIGEKIILAQRI